MTTTEETSKMHAQKKRRGLPLVPLSGTRSHLLPLCTSLLLPVLPSSAAFSPLASGGVSGLSPTPSLALCICAHMVRHASCPPRFSFSVPPFSLSCSQRDATASERASHCQSSMDFVNCTSRRVKMSRSSVLAHGDGERMIIKSVSSTASAIERRLISESELLSQTKRRSESKHTKYNARIRQARKER
eukprot:5471454-Pleurochrysis_carterae.AAC.2